MKKKIKILIIAIIGISLFSVLLLINFSLYESPESLQSVENISLVVDYNNGTIKNKTNFTLDNGRTTAFDALDKWCDVDYEDFGWGIIVRVIDGIDGNWIYQVNGYGPGVGASVYPLQDGDIVRWERV
jgi:hypothetical protein